MAFGREVDMKIKTMVFTALFIAVSASEVFGGTWKTAQDGRYWYDYDDGSHAYSAVVNIDGVNYGFDGEGYMLTGWQTFNYKWYYFDPATGAGAAGWLRDGGQWYYMDPASGEMTTGFRIIGNKKYHFDEASGKMDSGFFSVNGYMYFGENDPGKPDEFGALYRNRSEREPGTNRVIRFDEDGRATYKNDTTEAAAASGSEERYQALLDEEGMAEQRDRLEWAINEYSGDLQEELTDSYAKRVLGQSGQRYAERVSQWEDKARSVLSKYMSEDDISAYISSVEGASFTINSDGSYEVTLPNNSSDDDDADEETEISDYDYGDDDYDYGDEDYDYGDDE